MSTGAITGYIDVAQIALYVFWAFFAGLIYYLLRENKREGYPLESDRSAHITVQGWPSMPSPKTFKLQHGGSVSVPNDKKSPQELYARPTGNWPGAPLEPTGHAMLDGVGPGAYADRADTPDLTYEGTPRIVPLRADAAFSVARQDVDPRGLPVVGADGVVGGTVRDVWVDRSEMLLRYLEVEVQGDAGVRTVLLPINFSKIGQRQVVVRSILGSQFRQVPAIKQPDQVTLLEEEKVMAYYGAGTLYATAARSEPLL
ncbi:MAG: photosynthetic reaction center subunit H [Pseudomonadota bacterium]